MAKDKDFKDFPEPLALPAPEVAEPSLADRLHGEIDAVLGGPEINHFIDKTGLRELLHKIVG